MKLERKLSLRPWMFLYAALVASVSLAGDQGASISWGAAGVSPVYLDAELRSARPMVRRSDI